MNNFRNLWKDIKKRPGLAIAIILIGVVFFYSIYKSKNADDTVDDTTNKTGSFIILQGGQTQSSANDNGGGEPITTGTTRQFTVKNSQPLANKPGGTRNGGYNITTLPVGAALNYVSGPTNFGNSTYYEVTYGGKQGFVNANTIGL